MSGQWPPGWEDPDDLPGEADQQGTEAETGLSEVAAYLASVPVPVMPGSVEARISAALSVEVTARAGIAAPASGGAQGDRIARPDEPVQSSGSLKPDGAADARVLGPAPAQARVRRRDRQGRRREREMRKIFAPRRGRDVRTVLGKFVIGPLAVCLLIAVIALGLSHSGSSSSSAPSLGLAPQAAGTASSAAAASGGLSNISAAAKPTTAASSAAGSAFSSATGFAVTQTGTSYQKATLAEQAQAQVHAAQSRASGPTSVPSASSSSTRSATSAPVSSAAPTSSAPTAQLRACVLKVTGGVLPQLVDRATYQGTPAYVVASSTRVWVVGLGCTAAKTELIVSVALAGLRGNLRALVSVEQ